MPKTLAARLTPVLVAPFLAAGLLVGPGALPSAFATAGPDQAAPDVAVDRTAAPMRVERRTVLSPPAWVAPVAGYRLTGQYGDVSGLWSSAHTGVDLAAPSGTPIRSVTDGMVVEAGYAGAYGNHTVVRMQDGTEIWYSHQTSIDVAPGQRVAAGQVIGTVGSTGNVTGPHLHLEVRPGGGDPVDPRAALIANGVTP